MGQSATISDEQKRIIAVLRGSGAWELGHARSQVERARRKGDAAGQYEAGEAVRLLEKRRTDLNRIADRMENCSKWRFAIMRRNSDGGETGRSLVLGCRTRLCMSCNASRRGQLDREFRPRIAALAENGQRVLFMTFTRRPVETQDVRQSLDAVRAAFGAMRYGRAAREWWGERVAGGIYGLEFTLYRRNKKSGAPIYNAQGELFRRVHAHIHAVIVLQPGVDALAVGREVEARWLAECRELGWKATEAGQNIQEVSPETLADSQDATTYVVKYISKPADVMDARDAHETLIGAKGLRQVQAFGVLHGASLRKTAAHADVADYACEDFAVLDAEARAAAVAQLAEDAERAAAMLDDAEIARIHADDAEESVLAEYVADAVQTLRIGAERPGELDRIAQVREYASDAAQALRMRARSLEQAARIRSAERDEMRAETYKPHAPSQWRRLAETVRLRRERKRDCAENRREKRKRWQDTCAVRLTNAEKAEVRLSMSITRNADRMHAARTAGRMQTGEFFAKRLESAQRKLEQLPERMARAGDRSAAASARMAAAQAKLEQAERRAKHPSLHSDSGRGIVLAVRRKRVVESSRWRAVPVDDIAATIARATNVEEEAEARGYFGGEYAIRRARERREEAERWLKKAANARAGALVAWELTETSILAQESLQAADAAMHAARAELLAADRDLRAYARTMPVTIGTLRLAALAGCGSAHAVVATVDAGDAESEAKAAARREAKKPQEERQMQLKPAA